MSSNRRFYIEYCLNYTSSDSDRIGTRQTVRETLVRFDTVLTGSRIVLDRLKCGLIKFLNAVPEF